MKAYITKYALSGGIECVTAIQSEVVPSIISTVEPFSRTIYGENTNWHRTRESAIAKAESMRQRKIASLQKKIAKLEVIDFKNMPVEGE